MKRAYVLINCDLGKEENILETLRKIKSVKESPETFEAYDIIAEISSKNTDDLRGDITWKISKLPDIRSTLTLTGVEG
jgi:DNA-binding Lrp family transcriptional regulator